LAYWYEKELSEIASLGKECHNKVATLKNVINLSDFLYQTKLHRIEFGRVIGMR
jgi:hypothetical protein